MTTAGKIAVVLYLLAVGAWSTAGFLNPDKGPYYGFAVLGWGLFIGAVIGAIYALFVEDKR